LAERWLATHAAQDEGRSGGARDPDDVRRIDAA
jgi:hypothetical protein